ncbi:hypothetical protein Tco_0204664 [Tanacetum coccineum]
MEALQAAFTELARTVEGYIAQHSCSWCGGLFNGGNCLGCSSVGSGNEFVYDPNPYSYNETHNFFNQPPQHQYETYLCEYCGGSPHPGFDCQTWNTPVYDQGPRYNQDFGYDQPPFYPLSQPQQFECYEICGVAETADRHMQRLDEMQSEIDSIMMNLGTFIEVPFDDEQILRQHNIAQVTPPAYTSSLPFLTTMEPADTLLMGDGDSRTNPAREIDKFIKSSVDDLVPIPRESEVISDSNLECDMPFNTLLPTTDVREEDFDINSPLG